MKKRVFSLILFISLLVSLCACGEKETVKETNASTPAEETVKDTDTSTPVEVQIVEKGSISSENSVSGQTVSGTTESAFVSLSAKCKKVNVEVGDTVNKGQVICTLDLDSVWYNYETAQKNVQNAQKSYDDQSSILKEQLSVAEKNLSDTQALFAIGAASQMEVDTAKRTLDSTNATVTSTLNQLEMGIRSAKSSLDQLADSLEGLDRSGNVYAPIAGTITVLSASKDSYVSAGMPVVTIESTADMEISVGVSESLVAELTVGGTVDVTLSSLNLDFTSTISEISSTPNQTSHLYTVTIKIPPTYAKGMRSGVFADVTFYTNNQSGVVIVPTEAIQTGLDSSYVYTVDNGVAHKVNVETGLVGDGVTEITSGLHGGETLVTVGQFYLSEGTAVRVVSGEV